MVGNGDQEGDLVHVCHLRQEDCMLVSSLGYLVKLKAHLNSTIRPRHGVNKRINEYHFMGSAIFNSDI